MAVCHGSEQERRRAEIEEFGRRLDDTVLDRVNAATSEGERGVLLRALRESHKSPRRFEVTE